MNDIDRLIKDIKKMEKFPTRFLTGAVKKGAKIILLEAKARAPKKIGTLKKAMTVISEKSKTKGKRVAQITFAKEYNAVLAKISKNGDRSYYPSSQEYGWITKSGRKIAGKYFMRGAADSKSKQFESVVINDMMKRIEKQWAKGGLI